MTYIGKTILRGTTDDGSIVDIPVTNEGHLEAAIHAPRLPFGSAAYVTGSINTREDQ